MQPLLCLVTNQLVDEFPDPATALDDPDGLLAAGGDLNSQSLISAYRRGIFPWYSQGQPILWWCPGQRSVLTPGAVKVSRSLRKSLRPDRFDVRIDTNFSAVIDACAAPRSNQSDTWITPEMRTAYINLHRSGYAHSVECYAAGDLVGGLYGVAIGTIFFGESMFSRVSDASKVALVSLSNFLQHWGYGLIDCQIHNDHLASMGARLITRRDFLEKTHELIAIQPAEIAWTNKQLENDSRSV